MHRTFRDSKTVQINDFEMRFLTRSFEIASKIDTNKLNFLLRKINSKQIIAQNTISLKRI